MDGGEKNWVIAMRSSLIGRELELLFDLTFSLMQFRFVFIGSRHSIPYEDSGEEAERRQTEAQRGTERYNEAEEGTRR